VEDIDGVDFFRRGETCCPTDGCFPDKEVELFPLCRLESLRIVQQGKVHRLRENNGGRDHRAGQGASAHFVDTGDKGITPRTESSLELEHLLQPCLFHLACSQPAASSFGQLLHASPAVGLKAFQKLL